MIHTDVNVQRIKNNQCQEHLEGYLRLRKKLINMYVNVGENTDASLIL